MRALNINELSRVSGGFQPSSGWEPEYGTGPVYTDVNPEPIDVTPGDASPSPPSPTFPTAADVAISGAGLAASIQTAIASGGFAIPAAAMDLIDFLDNVGGYASTPSADQINAWNTISSFGIAPGSVYLSQNDSGKWIFDAKLNQIGGNMTFQITWRTAFVNSAGEHDPGGAIVEFL